MKDGSSLGSIKIKIKTFTFENMLSKEKATIQQYNNTTIFEEH